MQKCDFNFIENHTSAQVFLCKYAMYLHHNPFFINTSAELLLYIVRNIELTNVEALPKKINIVCNTFQYYKHFFTWWPIIGFQKMQ